ncbi:MAG: hypothetical protein FWC82_00855 [Firmicutes bacterium]|nr:hypothetical protein [Bacillota bacterium]
MDRNGFDLKVLSAGGSYRPYYAVHLKVYSFVELSNSFYIRRCEVLQSIA